MSPEDQARSEAAVAPPGAIVLGGRTFVIRPASINDHAAWRKELRRQIQASMTDPVEAVNRRVSEAERAGKPLSPTVVKYLVADALSADAAGAKIEPSDGQIAEATTTPDGARWWAWYLLRKADPTVTPKFIADHTPDDDAIFELSNRIAEAQLLKRIAPN